MNDTLNFDFSRSYRQPFPHAWLPRIFPENLNDQALGWLNHSDQWSFTCTDFYKQYEFSLKALPPPPELHFLTSDNTLQCMKSWIQTEFAIRNAEPTDVVAHLLVGGHGIGIHNDNRENGKTLRLLLQLNEHVVGGELAIFKNHRPDSVCRLIQPIHGTAFAFEISHSSYHAVVRVKEGRRFTIVYSFRSQP